MKVLVTGGTGFVGAHTVAALLAEGHDVRLLVRSRARIAPALAPLGIDDVDAIEGDCTDGGSVERAMQGCDSVVHCAAVFNWQPSAQPGLVETNTNTTDVVLGTAVEQRLEPIVHVSSYVALDPRTQPLTAENAVRGQVADYAGSKAESERVARRFQDAGAPVVTTYPGVVIGPHDPYLGESNTLLLQLLKPVALAAGRMPCVDVRDVAAIHAKAVTARDAPRRFLATGHDVSMKELARQAAAIAGVRSAVLAMTPAMAQASGRMMDAVGRHTPFPVPASSGAMRSVLEFSASDARSTTEALGVEFRPLDETLADTMAWLREAGHLRRRAAASTKPSGAFPARA